MNWVEFIQFGCTSGTHGQKYTWIFYLVAHDSYHDGGRGVDFGKGMANHTTLYNNIMWFAGNESRADYN